MHALIKLVALTASFLAFLATLGTGLFLAGIGESGARGAGLIMSAAAVVGFGSALVLAFGPSRYFTGRRRPLAMLAAVLALAPVVVIGGAALAFSGIPLGSSLPYVDWPAFALGIIFAAGGVAIIALGFLRASERRSKHPDTAQPPFQEEPAAVRHVMEARQEDADDVRVTKVG